MQAIFTVKIRDEKMDRKTPLYKWLFLKLHAIEHCTRAIDNYIVEHCKYAGAVNETIVVDAMQ